MLDTCYGGLIGLYFNKYTSATLKSLGVCCAQCLKMTDISACSLACSLSHLLSVVHRHLIKLEHFANFSITSAQVTQSLFNKMCFWGKALRLGCITFRYWGQQYLSWTSSITQKKNHRRVSFVTCNPQRHVVLNATFGVRLNGWPLSYEPIRPWMIWRYLRQNGRLAFQYCSKKVQKNC